MLLLYGHLPGLPLCANGGQPALHDLNTDGFKWQRGKGLVKRLLGAFFIKCFACLNPYLPQPADLISRKRHGINTLRNGWRLALLNGV